jgi:hypothetical protein
MWKCVRTAFLRLQSLRTARQDRRLGIVTDEDQVAAVLRGGRKASGPEPHHYYRATPYGAVNRILRRLAPARTDALLDFGSGAGRVVCIAAQRPFARIVGIDMDAGLHALAETNLRNLKTFVTRPEVFTADASSFRVPDEITIAFLYNPFGSRVLTESLTRIAESHDRKPRRLRVVYFNPQQEATLTATGRFRLTDTFAVSWRPGHDWQRTKAVKVYEVMPAEASQSRDLPLHSQTSRSETE